MPSPPAFLRWTQFCAVLALWAVAVDAWPQLPDRIPMHYGMDGRPDSWVQTSWLAWFGLPLFGTVMAGVMGFYLPSLMQRMAKNGSRWLNVPNQRQFLALPAAARVRAIAPMHTGLQGVSLAVLGLFLYLVQGGAAVALERAQALPAWPGLLCTVAMLACAIGMAIACSRAIRREFARTERNS